MIGAGLACDANFGAEEGRAEFGDQFLHGIGAWTKAFAEFPIAAALMARPVGQLVEERRIIGLGRRACCRACERSARRHVDAVGRGAIEGAMTFVMNCRAGRGDEALGGVTGNDRVGLRRRFREDETLYLLGGEDRRSAGEESTR